MENPSVFCTPENTTHVRKLRKQAKLLKKKLGIRHFEALDLVARKHGFINWDAAAAFEKGTMTCPSLDEVNSP